MSDTLKNNFMAKQIPTLGDHLIYVPQENDAECRSNGAKANPAVVTQAWPTCSGNYVNLTVFPDFHQPVSKGSVLHKSEATEGAEYWVWPWEYLK
jgi:hypothetical protein